MDTDPTNATSHLAIHDLAAEDNSHQVIAWTVSSNRQYTLYWSTNLLEGVSEVLLADYQPATSGQFSYTNEVGDATEQAFYRITVSVPE